MQLQRTWSKTKATLQNFNNTEKGCLGGKNKVSPKLQDGLCAVVNELLTKIARPGQGILIFLPGLSEQLELYNEINHFKLNGIETWNQQYRQSTWCKCEVFLLHSTVPQEEQNRALEEPPPDTVHIAISNNIAESSLTLPKLGHVIDFGLRRARKETTQ